MARTLSAPVTVAFDYTRSTGPVLGRFLTQAGQITAVDLSRQAFLIKSFCRCDGRGGRFVMVDFESFQGAAQIEQCKDFQFGNQLRGIRHRYSRLY